MAASRLPVLFISHGSPFSAFQKDDTSEFWQRLGASVAKLPGLRAMLFVSAHWETGPALRANTAERPKTIHDFYGFPPHFYEYHYPAKGSAAVAQRAIKLLQSSGFEATEDRTHGLDHGTWVPLKWMLPAGDVPIVQLSLKRGGTMSDHLRIGAALRPLRDEGVLIVGAGTAVHNLRDRGESNKVADFVAPFDNELARATTQATGPERERMMLDLERSPYLHKAHPSLEHLLPVHVAVGAADTDPGAKLHHHFFQSFSEASFSFGSELLPPIGSS